MLGAMNDCLDPIARTRCAEGVRTGKFAQVQLEQHPDEIMVRNAFFCTLPIALRGSSAANTTRLGTLKRAISPFSASMMAASLSA